MIRDPAYAAEIEVKNTCRAAGGASRWRNNVVFITSPRVPATK